MLLAGDIGGTKTVLGIFSSDSGPRTPLLEAEYRSADYAGLEELATRFLEKSDLSVSRAVFGVAGPVIRGSALVTNLPWNLDENFLGGRLGIPSVHLLNDLEALAYALPHATPSDLHPINIGKPEHQGSIAVIAPGTGLGEAFLAWDGVRYRAFPSEGGHGDFPPNSSLEGELFQYLQERIGHVSLETVCSGRGIPNIYRFLRDTGRWEDPQWLLDRIQEADDPTPVIVNAAVDEPGSCPRCAKTVELFVSILGAAAGNLALTVMSTRGVFLGGGIPPRIMALLQEGTFMKSFVGKGRMEGFLKRVPVHVIQNPMLPLVGAACFGMEWNEEKENSSGTL